MIVMEEGKLFVFEGPDGVGKTTLIQHAGKFFSESNIKFISLSFPGKTLGTLGYLIDKIHHKPSELELESISPPALQALHVAAHLDAIETRIKPALCTGTSVLLDRFWWSTLIYGKAAKVDEAVLTKLIEAEELCWGEIKPTIVFLVERASAFRAELSEEAFETASHLYEDTALLQESMHRVVRISNNDMQKSIDMIRQSITSAFNFVSSK